MKRRLKNYQQCRSYLFTSFLSLLRTVSIKTIRRKRVQGNFNIPKKSKQPTKPQKLKLRRIIGEDLLFSMF